ncbi:DUF4249 domain-containing protein [Flavobacterium sp. RHBU_3]|uniref:DUF4249 domain-containing protein n=1 Tax=Flavobacterium sp. RHBU_3 TaxID=3391184 RepID=UPI0039849D5C
MKKITYILLIATTLLFASCEEVVDVDLETAAPRLVVDASLDWVKGTAGNNQTIKLTTTTGYYETEVPVVSGASVTVSSSDGTLFTFIETPGTGEYVCNNFEPLLGETYTLTIISDGQTYTAVETLYPVPEITTVEQINDGGFLGDETEVRFYFMDDAGANNFYMVRFDAEILPFPDYDVFDDEFTQGNQMFGNFSDEDLEAGQTLGIKLFSISERYKNYMEKLLEVSSGNGGGPFTTTPASVRGNMVNQTNIDNYALGYFRVTEVDTLNYTITE